MSDQPSAFDTTVASTETAPAAPVAPAPVATPAPAIALSDNVQALIGEGKKYNSIEAALEALPHAQAHIETIEQENARIRADLDRSSTLDEAVSRIEATNVQTATPATPEVSANVRDEARSVYEEMTVEARKAANVEAANKSMYDLYGEKSFEVTSAVAAKLGLSVNFLKTTAEQSPQAYLKLVAETTKGDSGMPEITQSTINASAIDTTTRQDAPSAKLGGNAHNTKDMVNAWRGAGEIAKNNT